MDLPTLISTLLAETPLPTPGPSGANSPGDSSSGISQWLPLGTAFVGAAAAIGASALSQVLSASNERTRRAEQYSREDIQRRRDELKVTYSDLIRHLDEYLLAMHRFKGNESLIASMDRESETKSVLRVMAKQTELTEQMVVTISAVNSLLGVADLLDETAVFDAGRAYVAFIQDMKLDDRENKTKGNRLNSAMKDAMRRSLAGEPDPVE